MNKLVETIVAAIQDKKGKDIVTIDLRNFDGAICETFVVCNADSTVQVAAIASGVEDDTRMKIGEKVWRVNGQQNALWIAMDYGSVMVHIFQTEMRDYYRLEELWGDAPIIKYESED